MAALGAAAVLAVCLLACGRDVEVAAPAEDSAATDSTEASTGTNPPATPGNTPDTETTPGGIAGETEPGSTPTPEPAPQ